MYTVMIEIGIMSVTRFGTNIYRTALNVLSLIKCINHIDYINCISFINRTYEWK